MIYSSLEQLIGRTPMLELNNLQKEWLLGARLLGKLESFNPAGSVKDRVARSLLEKALQNGSLKEGGTVIEPTSGNTGIGLAALAASKGLHMIVVMPDTMSLERRQLMAAYGAEVVLTPGVDGMNGAIKKANELKDSIEGSIVAGQFDNPANPAAHIESTGPEIWQDTEGKVDVFVAGVGTGGTITGVGRYLKSKNPNIEIVAVEPAGSPYLSEGRAGEHNLQGIGAGFIPGVLDTDIYDRIIPVTEEDAYDAARTLGKKEGFLVGISSGAALFAAATLAKLDEYKGKNIVVLLPDTGDRYLSTQLFG
ncbi:MAG: cysteine synthase A [Clostridia bacterium]|nr:cysteine synthase A [Clostridia bacterium]